MYLFLGSFCLVVWSFAGVEEAFSYQQDLDRTSNTEQQRNENNGPTEFFTSKPPQYYECLGTGICETGVHFCSERLRRCEKCSDYKTACWTNVHYPNCTQYCKQVLMEEKCNVTVIAKPSPTTTENVLNYTQKTNSSALTNNPETCFHWNWIYVICSLGIVLAISLSCNMYQHCRSKQFKQTRCTNVEQTELLMDQPSEVVVDTPTSLHIIGDQKTSDCPKQDNSHRHSLTPSAPLIGNESLDQEETSIKSHNKRLLLQEPEDVEPCKERQAGPRDQLPGQDMDADINTSSGCSSASSTLSRISSGVTSNNTINITIQNGQTDLSITPTGTKKKYTQPEIPRKDVPYSVEETDADFNHGKLVSEEDTNGKLALLETSAGIGDLKTSYI
ncbi:hypothetical protein ACJMK2_023347 [Sinanodonta woodiana]|uniref:Uncharacterized protein n=1 Tax=Sinanodonta woodiana TaxID=1069815 RepID=A0ABD3T4S1_SINWO